MIMSVLITATLAATVDSLWIGRHTWRSRFEAGASLNIALQGCAVLLLMSPWASVILGPALHRIVRRWNVEDLLDHMCLIVAVMAIIHHRLAQLTNEKQLSGLFRRHIETPVRIAVLLLVAVVVVADEGYHPDLFPRKQRLRCQSKGLGCFSLPRSAITSSPVTETSRQWVASQVPAAALPASGD